MVLAGKVFKSQKIQDIFSGMGAEMLGEKCSY